MDMKKAILRALALTLALALPLGAAAQTQRVMITAGGDVLLGGSKAKKTDVYFESFIDQYGDGYVFKNYLPLFSTDDITIVNLEGPLKISSRMRKPSKSVHMYGKPKYARILKAGSIEVANIVNNHIDDYNTRGATREILAEQGIVRSDSKFSVKNNSVLVRGVRVGFIGYQTPCSLETIRKGVRKVKSACDVAVVSFHFGEVPQHTSQIRQSQIRAAHAAIDAGADLVLGHHPHVVSGIELYKDRYVFYDLGSVQSSGKHFRYHNMVARITLEVDTQTGKITCLPPVIYPGFTSGAGRTGLNNCQPVLYTPDDPGYETVFGIIDEASSHKKITPGPYKRGVI